MALTKQDKQDIKEMLVENNKNLISKDDLIENNRNLVSKDDLIENNRNLVSKDDLKEVISDNNDKLIKLIDYKLDELKDEMVTKSEFNELKDDVNQLSDDVSAIRKELNTEHNFRYRQLKSNTRKIVTIEKHLRLESP